MKRLLVFEIALRFGMCMFAVAVYLDEYVEQNACYAFSHGSEASEAADLLFRWVSKINWH